MYIFYDADSDTLQTRTRARDNERHAPLLVPEWEPVTWYSIPDWYADALESASVAENMLAPLTINA